MEDEEAGWTEERFEARRTIRRTCRVGIEALTGEDIVMALRFAVRSGWTILDVFYPAEMVMGLVLERDIPTRREDHEDEPEAPEPDGDSVDVEFRELMRVG